jgi:hypothetical protein
LNNDPGGLVRRLIGNMQYWLTRQWRRRRVVRIEGPLEKVGNRWLMRIPLTVGGDVLSAPTQGIGQIKNDILEIELPDQLVKNLNLKEGQHLFVHNATGEFTFEWYQNGTPRTTSTT